MPPTRRGISLIYCTMILVAMVAITSLAVDLGRVQLVKTELRRASDASARAAAVGLSTSMTAVQSLAQQYAQANTADGSAIALDTTNDVAVGTWDSATRTFTAGNFSGSNNAVKVTLRRTAARGNAVPLTFASVLGRSSFDLTVSAIAVVATNNGVTVHTTYNPYRAGHSGLAPGHDPSKVSSLPLTPGHSLNFSGLVQTTTLAGLGADGDSSNVVTLPAQNGISGIQAPQGALVGVFLDDSDPSFTAAPSALDFSNNGKRNFSSLSPLLKQLFFIGNGQRVSPNDQNFIVPTGATRLFIGVVDSTGYLNDASTYQTTSIDGTTGAGGANGAISIAQ
jgi:Flp pilus assembly protein TadG